MTDNCKTILEVFLPAPVAPQLHYLMGMSFWNEDRIVTDLSVAITDRAAAELEQLRAPLKITVCWQSLFLAKKPSAKSQE